MSTVSRKFTARPAPRTEAIAGELRAAMTDGSLPAGSRLPSERELTGRYGVARGTVRAAIDILRAEGLVVSHGGRGVFVRVPQESPRITLRTAAYDHAFNVPLTIAQINELVEGKTLLLEFGPDTELQLGVGDPQNVNIAVILRPAPGR